MASLLGRHPRILLLTVVLVLAGGWSAWTLLPRREDPLFVERWAYVVTPFPGSGAERVEALVTEPLEDALRGVRGVKKTSSISRAGISVITVELEPRITDVEPTWSLVRDRMRDAAADLPTGVGRPRFDREEFQVYTAQVGLTWKGSGPAPAAVIARMSKELERALRGVSGTVHTQRYGAPEEEVLVEVAKERLQQTGLSVSELARRVGADDAKVSAGIVRGRTETLPLEVAGAHTNLARLRGIPVAVGEDGQSVRLDDVGTVRRGFRDPPSQIVLVDGHESVMVAARMSPDRRGDVWATDVRAAIEDFNRRVPANLKAELVFDQTRYTKERLGSLFANMVLGGVLVVGVVLLLMGWRSTLLVTAALPLTLALVLLALQIAGIALEQMSIVGLIMALGLLIDNAIVVVDELRERIGHGATPLDAVKDTVRSLRGPLIGSTLTTVFALMPMVLLSGATGDFVRSLAIALILALVLSLGVALTLLPALGMRISGAGSTAQGIRGWLDRGIGVSWITAGYRRVVASAVAHPIAAITIALALPIGGMAWSGSLREQFFPPAERDQIQVQLNLAAHASITETRQATERAEQILREHPDVARVTWFIGTSAPFFYYNMTSGKFRMESFAQAIVQLKTSRGISALVRDLQGRLDAQLPEADVLALQFEQGPPLNAPIEVKLLGDDVEVLQSLGTQIRATLAEVPRITHTRSTLGHGRAKVVLAPEGDVVRGRGLSRSDLARALRSAMEGVAAGSILEGTQQLPVRVRLRAEDRGSLAAMESLPVSARDGGAASPVGVLGEASLVAGWAEIPRNAGTRCNQILGFVPAGTLPAPVLASFKEALSSSGFTLPEGYRLEIGGESAERNDAVADLGTWALPLLLLLASTLVISFKSFRCALIVAFVGAASVGLALAALRLFGYPLGFMAIVGTIGLIGVAVNDAIVVLAGIRADRAARAGDRQAIAEVVVRSTRHVLATTLTTIFGFIPLVLAGGGFWPPLAIVISGGLAGATLLALTFVPAAYVMVARMGNRLSRA